MASINVSNNPSSNNNTLTVNFTTDVTNITNIQISKDGGSSYISATSFNSTSATFDISSWDNGTYTNCKLKCVYTQNAYNITNNLTNCTTNNNSLSIEGGSSYSATISANTNYEMSSITVTMGGTDITSSVVNGYVINISNVTGNIVITASATAIQTTTTYTITNNLSNCSTSNSNKSISSGSSYSATISPNANYTMSNISVTMGGTNITSSAVSGNAINITNVTGNIVITASATIITRTVTYNLSNCTSSNTSSNVNNGSSYSTTITSNGNYTMSSISVTMGGVDITSSTVSNGNITISSVTGNIVITATATQTSSGGGSVTNLLPPLSQWNRSSGITSVTTNGDYTATITSNASWEFISTELTGISAGDSITLSCSDISNTMTIEVVDVYGGSVASISKGTQTANMIVRDSIPYSITIYMSGGTNGTISDMKLIKNS